MEILLCTPTLLVATHSPLSLLLMEVRTNLIRMVPVRLFMIPELIAIHILLKVARLTCALVVLVQMFVRILTIELQH